MSTTSLLLLAPHAHHKDLLAKLHAQAPTENRRRPGQAQTEYVGSQDHVSTEEKREQS
jgi:hypothetical protein